MPVVGLRGVYEVDNEIRGEGITVKLPTVNNTEVTF